MFYFQFQRLQSSRIFFAFGIIFRITVAHVEFKIIESNGFKIHRAAVAGPYAFLVGPYGFFRPALLDEGVRPSYGTFFLMVFQGNSARVRTGHMIKCLLLLMRKNNIFRLFWESKGKFRFTK